MNTGVQRVVRGLYRALSALTLVTPLIWDPGLSAYCVLSRRERAYLENPFAGRAAADAEPGRRANPVPLWSKFVRRITHRRNRLDLPARLTASDTLCVPEIFQDNRLEWLDAVAAGTAARRVGIFYDALIWRRPDIMPSNRQAGFVEYINVLGGFDQVATISEESAADLRACWNEYGRKTERMPPVSVVTLPVDHLGPERRLVPPPDATAGRPSVLCVATFEPRKNHLGLLEAAEKVWSRGVDFELTLIGRTTAHWGARVETALEKLQAAGRTVRWLRHIDDAALRRAYEQCAFTVFPSLAEGYGIPIAESLWYGRPCVCGVNGAIGEAAGGGGCLAVEQSDPEALAEAMETLLTDPALYTRLCDEAARRTFGTWEQLARRLLTISGIGSP